MVYEHENIEDLGVKGYKVIQNKRGFCFGSDAVLLSRFTAQTLKKGATMLDMCSGTGIVAVLVKGLAEPGMIDTIELMDEVAEMAKRTMKLNNLEDSIRVTCGDLKDAVQIYGKRAFDAITCNPPYMNAGAGIVNPKDLLAVARHEIACNLDDIIRVSKSLLKPCGKLYMVHRADRMCDVIETMRKYRIEPKRMRIVYPSETSVASLILVEGAENGKPQLKLEEPLLEDFHQCLNR